MNKTYITLAAFAVAAAGLLINVQPASAADALKNTTGEKITVNDFTFQVSPQVDTVGDTTTEGFVVGAAHAGSYGKTNGEAYAMSSATSGLYAITVAGDITAPPAVPAVADAKDVEGKLGDYTLVGKATE